VPLLHLLPLLALRHRRKGRSGTICCCLINVLDSNVFIIQLSFSCCCHPPIAKRNHASNTKTYYSLPSDGGFSLFTTEHYIYYITMLIAILPSTFVFQTAHNSSELSSRVFIFFTCWITPLYPFAKLIEIQLRRCGLLNL
jgi:hypothetical protein